MNPMLGGGGREGRCALSVNVNKVALLRNTRHLGIPSVLRAAELCLQAGAQGITVHPRPDARHIRRDDVLALARNFDLLEWIETELIMAQPIVPRHDVCPTDVAALMNAETETPVPGRPAEPEATEEVPLDKSGKPNPFAVLAALKKGGK